MSKQIRELKDLLWEDNLVIIQGYFFYLFLHKYVCYGYSIEVPY